MVRDTVQITLSDYDASVSAALAKPTTIAINATNGAVVPGFFQSKDNSAWLLVNATTAGDVVLVEGDAFRTNNILGSLSMPVTVGLNLIQIERHGRFENKDGSLNIDFEGGVAGTITAFAKRAGLK